MHELRDRDPECDYERTLELMVSLGDYSMQAQTSKPKPAKATITQKPKCPLCHAPMQDGQKTDFRQLALPNGGGTVCRRVHTICPGGING